MRDRFGCQKSSSRIFPGSELCRNSIRPELVEGLESRGNEFILHCADGSYYTGHTDNLDKRIMPHETAEIEGYTSARLPVKLVFAAEFSTRVEALARERQIKGWNRKKKEAMIRGDWAEVSRLACGKRPSTSSGRTGGNRKDKLNLESPNHSKPSRSAEK